MIIFIFYAFTSFLIFISEPLRANTSKHGDKNKNWSQILKTIPQGVANPLITKAIDLSLKRHPKDLNVIDLGAGTGRNISGLLEKGAKIYAYDASPASIHILNKEYSLYIRNKNLFVFEKYFQEIEILPKADLIIAWRSLSFMAKDDFLEFWPKIKHSLTPHAVFTGTFFGEKHYTKMETNNTNMSRLSHGEVIALFKDLKILHFQEEFEYDEKESKKAQCHQFEHLYRIIAIKEKS